MSPFSFMLVFPGIFVMEKERVTDAGDDWDNSRELLETLPDR